MLKELIEVISVVLFFGFISGFATAQKEPLNLPSNPGFEELDERGFPKDWEAVGETVEVSTEAHSGKYSLRMKRTAETTTIETGLNRAWKPDSGQQGAMLDVLKGGIKFWYKALSAEKAKLNIYVIPMSARPWEDTGEPRASFTVPQEHIGDGIWHQGVLKYDYIKEPKVKWVHISARIVGQAGELLLDDIAYVEKVGVQLRISEITLIEDERLAGESCTIKATVDNVGDASASAGSAEIILPGYLKVAEGPTIQPLPSLPADEKTTVTWKVIGRREKPDEIKVKASANDIETSGTLKLAPKLQIICLKPQRFILAPQETTDLYCLVTNPGNAIVTRLIGNLKLDQGLQLAVADLLQPAVVAPGKKVSLRWSIQATKETKKATAFVEVMAENCEGRRAETHLVVLNKPTKPIEPANKLQATVKPEAAVLENQYIRILFPKSGFGFGSAELQTKKPSGWLTVAKMPYLSRLIYQSEDGRRQEERIYGSAEIPSGIARGRETVLKFKKELQDVDGGLWTLEFAFALRNADNLISFDYKVQCDRPRKILCFEGPMLYVGEGSFGEEKDEAILPGLEWLVGDEISSSSLDIAEDHPDRLRYVPHPNKITIPAMAIFSQGAAVGLLWDVYQKWDGSNDRPSAVFASPDYFEGRTAHLMGLFLPSVPHWVKENHREAAIPYELKANKPLTLKGQILLDGKARDPLVAMDRWFDLYGVPNPMPIPRGSYQKEVEFSLQAYLDSLWVPEEEQWWLSRGAGPLLSQKGRSAAYCYDLLMGALITEDKQLRQKSRERAQRVLELMGVQAKPSAEDLGFTWANPLSHLVGMGSAVAGLMDEMWEDGSWRFDADHKDLGVFKGMDYHELGPDNAAELGTCARNAYVILRFARMTGDREAFESGAKSLKFMEQFIVPRAAQVWEVPVHTPDILAASDAVDAYLEGYRFSGDKHYLEQAKRWARRGLPFLYAWNTPEFPFMRYASIPVFGASWFQASWFGRAVQWNGLRFSYALLKLSEYDRSFPWKKVAEGIVRSAMYQQSTNKDDIALWPDSISLIDASKSSWIFAPRLILQNIYKILGRQEEPETMILGTGSERLHINSGAEISKASWKANKLKFELTYPEGESGYTLIAAIDRPTKVSVNQTELPEVADISKMETPGWHYDTAHAYLIIYITKDGKSTVEIEGAKHRYVPVMPKLATEIEFNFETDIEGWVSAHDLTPLQIDQGKLVGRTTGGDPYMIRSRMKIQPDRYKTLTIRMKITAGTIAQVYWTTSDSPAFAEDKVLRFEIQADNEFHEYRLDIGSHPMWKGKEVTALRLDPNNAAPGAEFEVDWIRGE